MSYTSRVKEDILAYKQATPPLLSAFLKLSASIGITQEGLRLSVMTESRRLASYIAEALKDLYQLEVVFSSYQKTNLSKNTTYKLDVVTDVDELLHRLHLADFIFALDTGIPVGFFTSDQDKQDYLCGAFLASGTIKDPDNGKYQLELTSTYQDFAQGLMTLMQTFLLDAKIMERPKGSVVYLQRAEDILDFLLVIGATKTRDEYENVKVLRETRNNLNRATNAEAANITRTITASLKIIQAIETLDDKLGLENLPLDLQEVARMRLAHPDYSIQEIANNLAAPITKSGVNHRLRKLQKMADDLN